MYRCICLQVVAVPLDKFVCFTLHNCPPNCTCFKRPSDRSFSVSCDSGTQEYLPKSLPDPDYPPPRTGRFHLNFSGSNIQTLESRHYLTKTRLIDVSKSKLHLIPHDVWKKLSKMDHVDLSQNQLAVLPTFLGSKNITFRWLALHGNPLRCKCEDKWIRAWLESLGNGLFAPCYQPPVMCGSPDRLKNKNIFHLNDEDFCGSPNYESLHIIEVCEPQAIVYNPFVNNYCHTTMAFIFLK